MVRSVDHARIRNGSDGTNNQSITTVHQLKSASDSGCEASHGLLMFNNQSLWRLLEEAYLVIKHCE